MNQVPAVAHIKDHFLPLSETFIYTLLRSIRRYRSIVVDRHHRQHEDVFPFADYFSPVERFGLWAGWAERAALRWFGRSPYIEHVLRAKNVRLIHAHFGQLGALFVPVARRLQIPLVTSFYGRDLSTFAVHPAWKERFEALWAYGRCFLVLGSGMADTLRALGCAQEKIHVLPLPLDLSQFQPPVRAFPSPDEPAILLTVGRLIPKKGVDVLLHALSRLGHEHNVILWVVGDGPERPSLEALTNELGLQGKVKFLGWRSHADVISLMGKAHLFVLASRTDPQTGEREGTPTVLLEAQAMELPVISTKHADIPEIVHEGKTGLLVPEGDAEALANALERMLSNRNLWLHMGRAGRTLVEAKHDMHRVGRHLEHIYDACKG